MKKILFLFGFILFCAAARGQTPHDTVNVYDPQNFTEMTTIDVGNAQLITRKNSLNRRIHLDTLRKWITPDVLQAWAGDPLDSVDVNSAYWDQFVTDSLGRVWFVDSDGDAKMLKDTAQTGVTDGDKGDITVSVSGATWNIDAGVVGASEIASTAVTPGSYTNTSLTVDADGRITAASNGAAVDSSIYELLPAGDVAINAATNNLDITNMTRFGIGADTLNATGVTTFLGFPSGADGDGIFDAGNDGDTVVVQQTYVSNNWDITAIDQEALQFENFGYIQFAVDSLDKRANNLRIYKYKTTIEGTNDALVAGYVVDLDNINQEIKFKAYNTADSSVIDMTKTKIQIISDTLNATGVTTFLGFPTGTDTDNQTIDTFSRSGSTIYLSLEDDGQAAKQLNLSIFLQTLDTDRDTLSISGSGTILRVPGPAFLRDSITGAALTIDLKTYNQAVVEIRMETCTSTTLTINNPWSATDIDATYPTFEGETGVYSFHFLGISGTDNITWPADFLDMNGTALGTDALTTGTMYTCYRNPVSAKYYCK